MNFKAITDALANTQHGTWPSRFCAKKTLSSSAEGKWIKLTGSWATAHGKDRRVWWGKRKNNKHISRKWSLGDAGGCEWLASRSTAWIWLRWAITPNSMACVRGCWWEEWDYNPGTSIQMGISMAKALARRSQAGGEREVRDKRSFGWLIQFSKHWRQTY